MKKVVNINDRLKDKKRKHEVELYNNKVEILQRLVHCSSCQFKCAMCGDDLKAYESPCPQNLAPSGIILCKICRTEFEEFLKLTKENKKSDIDWHNEEWKNLWATWLDYQHAIAEYRNSKEFRQLSLEPED